MRTILILFACIVSIRMNAQQTMSIPGCKDDSDTKITPWDLPIKDFINRTGSSTPSVGGGFVCIVVACEAMSLALLSSELTLKKGMDKEHEQHLRELVEIIKTRIVNLSCFAEKDKLAYQTVLQVMKLPASTPEERKERDSLLEQANYAASIVPLDAVEAISDMLVLIRKLTPYILDSMLSDVMASVFILQGAASGLLGLVKDNNRNLPISVRASLINSISMANNKIQQECTQVEYEIYKRLSHQLR